MKKSQEQEDYSKIFDRQTRIEGWQQDKLQNEVYEYFPIYVNKVALCLGIGGLGSVVLINLLRLGVKKIIIVDKDVVDDHNLNRQIIFSKADIGISKVSSAVKNSAFHNVANSIIESYHICALKCWPTILKLISQSTIVFNMIDVGDYFDLAIQSACIKYKVPLIIGGTFSQSGSIEYYNPIESGPCFACLADNLQKEWIEKLQPDQLEKFENLEAIPKNDNPIGYQEIREYLLFSVGQSNAFLCSTCGNLMVSMYVNKLFENECTKEIYRQLIIFPVNYIKRFMFYVSSFEIIKWEVTKNDSCLLCSKISK